MSSNTAPYATLHDLPKYEKRADVVGAPWFKDQPTVQCGRGHDPEPYITCNSQTAPFATFHNLPKHLQSVTPLPDNKEQQPPVVRGSQVTTEHNKRKDIPFGTSDDVLPQANKTQLHQAPWDRDEVHYNTVLERFPHGEDAPHYTSAHAPFATDSK